MTAHTVPLIYSPLTNQAVQFAQQSYSHLADLKLADQLSEDCESKVDVLIGNDSIGLSSLKTQNGGNQDLW